MMPELMPELISKLRRPWVALPGALILILVLAACTQLRAVPWPRPFGVSGFATSGEVLQIVATPPSADQGSAAAQAAIAGTPAASAVPAQATATPDQPPRGTIAVRRGPIAEELLLNGRVVGVDEVPLSFPTGGIVRAVPVEQGKAVKPGQLLVELDSKQLTKDRDAAQARVETSTLRLQQMQARAQAQAQLRQREQERRQREAEYQRQKAIAEAERAYNRAKADLELVRAGSSAAERSAARAAVVAARANLDRLKADQSRVTRGPDPDEIRNAESQVANAEITLAAAQADLDKLTRGAAPENIHTAERNVERAQIALKAAQASAADPNSAATKASRDAAVADAQVGLREAQERLESLRRPPSPADVDLARKKADVAKLGLDIARQRLEKVRKAGPDEQTMAAAQSAIASAEAAVKSAEDRLADLNSRPSPADVQDAEAKVALAAAALEYARAADDVPVDQDDSANYDILIAQKGLEQDRAQFDALERDLAAAKLVAPFAGVIVLLKAQANATVEAGRPVVVLARAGQPVIEASLFDSDAARIARGQRATVQVDGGDGTRLNASLLDFIKNPIGAGTIARIGVNWSNTSPAFGATARVRVVLQERSDALLVPRLALREAADRRYVDVFDNGVRRPADVEVGIVTSQAAEILSGLSEGQAVLVGPQ